MSSASAIIVAIDAVGSLRAGRRRSPALCGNHACGARDASRDARLAFCARRRARTEPLIRRCSTAARLCGVERVFKVGGAQAIAAMAYGTQSIPKVDKVFGPGNAWVTAAKLLVSNDPDGAALDLPAGPSEVLVIADETARAEFVAADLLAQAEHSADAQVVLRHDIGGAGCERRCEELEQQMRRLGRESTLRAIDRSQPHHRRRTLSRLHSMSAMHTRPSI